jgi:hypothetical protein
MKTTDTQDWWQSKRLDYNIWLIIAGILSFLIYGSLVWSFPEAVPEAEITAFTVIFQGVGYLIAMGIANLCFYAGQISEDLFKPKNLEQYRQITYQLGKWFSFILPFMIPMLILLTIINVKNA